jgi:hypothetical protein
MKPTDFDFLLGKWSVRHRRLKSRLTGCADWEEFGGSMELRSILGGLGNLDDNLLDLPGGAYRAVTLRSFDEQSGNWSIWWLDSRHPHRLDVPVVGRFVDGVGTFLADDTLDGKPIQVRFLWRPSQLRWEQAFSPDAGAAWETNWIMEFTAA